MTWIDDAKKLADAATPGPWEVNNEGVGKPCPIEDCGYYGNQQSFPHFNGKTGTYQTNTGKPHWHNILVNDTGYYPPGVEDATFIAQSRELVPRLIKALELVIETHGCDCCFNAERGTGWDTHSRDCISVIVERIKKGEF